MHRSCRHRSNTLDTVGGEPIKSLRNMLAVLLLLKNIKLKRTFRQDNSPAGHFNYFRFDGHSRISPLSGLLLLSDPAEAGREMRSPLPV